MVSRNMIYFGVAFFVVVILVVGVSAKHAAWHFWGPDVQEAPFDATVSLANAAPTIIHMEPVVDMLSSGALIDSTACTGSDCPGDVAPQANGIVYSIVSFVVQDVDYIRGTNTELATDPAEYNDFPNPTATNDEIAVRISSPSDGILCAGTCRNRDTNTGNFPTGHTTCESTVCDVSNSVCNDGLDTSPINGQSSLSQIQYTCYVQMQYFDEPSVTAEAELNDFWNVTMYIEDNDGASSTATSSDFSGGTWEAADEQYIVDYNTVNGIALEDAAGTPNAENLLWTGLITTNYDTAADDDNDVDDPNDGLDIRNVGNQLITSLDVTGNHLESSTTDAANSYTDYLSVNAISVGDSAGTSQSGDAVDDDVNNACDTADLETDPFVAGGAGSSTLAAVANDLNVPFTSVGKGTDFVNIYFCMYQRIDAVVNPTGCGGGPCIVGVSDNSYSANDPCNTAGTAACDNTGEQWNINQVVGGT